MKQNALSRETALRVLQTYGDAWVTQDTAKILTVFADDATYHERPLGPPHRGHQGIATYWDEKVVQGQSRIQFRLLNTYIDGSTVIAEWEAYFTDLRRSVRRHIVEVAILEFEGGLISTLREYWTSEEVAESQEAPWTH